MLFLFDYDGVIVDSFAPLLELGTQAQRIIGHGRPPMAVDFQTIENLTFDDVGRLIGIPEEKITSYSEKVFELQSKNWNVSPFPRIVEVFRQLASQHVLAVITASQSAAVRATLDEFGLGSVISQVLGGELGTSKAERIAVAQSLHSSPSAETFMTGDAISDIREGKKAGVNTVAVSWGFQDRELLYREDPDFLIDTPEDLLSIASNFSNPVNEAASGENRG